jgi:hypothetical protein
MTRLAGLRIRVGDPEPVLRVLALLGLRAAEEIELETGSEGPDGIVELAFARPDGGTLRIQTNPTSSVP